MSKTYVRLIALFAELIIIAMTNKAFANATLSHPINSIVILEQQSDRLSHAFSSHLKDSLVSTNLNVNVRLVNAEQSSLIQKIMGSSEPQITTTTDKQNSANQFNNQNGNKTTKQPELLITSGKYALTRALVAGYNKPILAVLINSTDFRAIQKKHPKLSKNVSAIFHQAPLIRQLLLFKEIYPNGKRVGLLLSPHEVHLIDALKSIALKLDLVVEYEVINDNEELSKKLLKLISRSDAIIATKNNTIYNRSTIKSILLTLYRHNKFLIGADQNFIRPGSIATTYTSLQQLISEVIDTTQYFYNNNKKLPATHFSQRFDVVFNQEVARSLNINIKGNSHYTDLIQAIELNMGEVEIYE
ncbi:ABC transporter substrate-binding protein [Pleionea mediterranea]|uniref:ABC-type uncharacterized transport system substrate-binding protein n=1 Tax=Pleionea mediterranea TaxID=523701 RepID=A0A316FQT6_9GAMM|nr:ABC transporter substrate binding protein [Pleionea mediterranea]PWK50076.1 ABC-type uncharacterized transport system substrate-binding protein [Pleionea mediterranea]